MSTIKIELTLEEANMVLRVLGKHPFEEVVSLISKIKEQGDPQAAAIAAEASASAELPAA